MADGLSEILSTVLQQVDELIQINSEVRSKLAEKEKEIDGLNYELAKTRKELETAYKDIDYLKVSYKLASNPNDLIESRRYISRIIRNIDKCISELKE
jgi:uncharacterized coiled-coil protein SlyX